MLKTLRFIAILGNVVVLCAACYAFALEVRSSSDTVQLLVISGFFYSLNHKCDSYHRVLKDGLQLDETV